MDITTYDKFDTNSEFKREEFCLVLKMKNLDMLKNCNIFIIITPDNLLFYNSEYFMSLQL